MNEIAKVSVCIQLRSGVEIWVEEERGVKFMALLSSANAPQFVEYEGRLINKADVVGVFKPSDMEASVRRRNGEWTCQLGSWHSKGEKCQCITKSEKALLDAKYAAIRACGKCENGMIRNLQDDTVGWCSCIQHLMNPI